MPELHQGKHILIVAHHNSLRGLMKHVDNISDHDIANIRIRTADPILYQLNAELVPLSRENLRPRSAFSRFTQNVLGHWIQRLSR